MTLLLVAAGFLLGVIAGIVILRRIRSQVRHIDYKKRWEEAIDLLNGEGRLTQEQVDQLMGKPPKPPVVSAELREIRKMATWDRRDIEVARARKGLPPLDDLAGMASWDKADVMKARAKAGLRKIEESDA